MPVRIRCSFIWRGRWNAAQTWRPTDAPCQPLAVAVVAALCHGAIAHHEPPAQAPLAAMEQRHVLSLLSAARLCMSECLITYVHTCLVLLGGVPAARRVQHHGHLGQWLLPCWWAFGQAAGPLADELAAHEGGHIPANAPITEPPATYGVPWLAACRATRRRTPCGRSAWRSSSSTAAPASLVIACRRPQRCGARGGSGGAELGGGFSGSWVVARRGQEQRGRAGTVVAAAGKQPASSKQAAGHRRAQGSEGESQPEAATGETGLSLGALEGCERRPAAGRHSAGVQGAASFRVPAGKCRGSCGVQLWQLAAPSEPVGEAPVSAEVPGSCSDGGAQPLTQESEQPEQLAACPSAMCGSSRLGALLAADGKQWRQQEFPAPQQPGSGSAGAAAASYCGAPVSQLCLGWAPCGVWMQGRPPSQPGTQQQQSGQQQSGQQ